VPVEVPKYQRIADSLRARIDAGEFDDADGQLPGERALSESEEVSLETIRKALAVLVAEGRIDIRHGAGVFVRRFKRIVRDANRRLSAAQWGQGHAIWNADLGLRPLDIVELTVTTQEAPEWVAQRLDTQRVVVRDRVFVVEGRRVQMATSYLPAELVAGSPIEQEDTGAGGTLARLRDLGIEVASFDEDSVARVPTPAEARRLRLGRGAWVVEIVRNALTETERIVEVNRMILDADAYVLHTRIAA
jgi:GntR family transcriptional regulator